MKQAEFFQRYHDTPACGKSTLKAIKLQGILALSYQGIVLDNAQGNPRAFSSIDTIAKVCKKNGAKLLTVVL